MGLPLIPGHPPCIAAGAPLVTADPCFWSQLLPWVLSCLGQREVWRRVGRCLMGAGWSVEAQQAGAALLMAVLEMEGSREGRQKILGLVWKMGKRGL